VPRLQLRDHRVGSLGLAVGLAVTVGLAVGLAVTTEG
jgi:hypothetical protein